MWPHAADVTIKTRITAHALMKHSYHICSPSYTRVVLARKYMDLMLSWNANPSPSCSDPEQSLPLIPQHVPVLTGEGFRVQPLGCSHHPPSHQQLPVVSAPAAVGGRQRGTDYTESVENPCGSSREVRGALPACRSPLPETRFAPVLCAQQGLSYLLPSVGFTWEWKGQAGDLRAQQGNTSSSSPTPSTQ